LLDAILRFVEALLVQVVGHSSTITASRRAGKASLAMPHVCRPVYFADGYSPSSGIGSCAVSAIRRPEKVRSPSILARVKRR
jgi:hypothetical protein